MEKIKSLLTPLGFRLERGERFLSVIGEQITEVTHVASSLSLALFLATGGKEKGEELREDDLFVSLFFEGKGEETIVLEDADLSRVERELAKIKRLREQRELWRRAGLPDSCEAAKRGWWHLKREARLVETVPLGEDQLQKVLEEARVLYARTLAREIHST